MQDLDDALKLYIEKLTYEKNFSAHTIIAYQNDISEFINFLNIKRCQSLQNITPMIISEWLEYLAYDKLSSRTITRKLSSMRVFFTFLQKQNIYNKNPFLLFSSPKSMKHIPTVLSITEMHHLLMTMPENTIFERRNKSLLILLYTTGMRADELCQLTYKNTLLNQNLLKIIGKGKKERLIPLIPSAKNAIVTWLKEREILNKQNSDILFLSKSGKPLQIVMIWKIVQKVSQSLNTKRIHPHVFRYTFATHLLERGANLRHIQELLGHANIAVTERYTSISIKNLKEKYKNFHPRG